MSMTIDTQREVLTIEEAARVLGVSRWLAYEEARSGSLGGAPIIRIGRRMLVSRRALDRVLDAQIGGDDDPA